MEKSLSGSNSVFTPQEACSLLSGPKNAKKSFLIGSKLSKSGVNSPCQDSVDSSSVGLAEAQKDAYEQQKKKKTQMQQRWLLLHIMLAEGRAAVLLCTCPNLT